MKPEEVMPSLSKSVLVDGFHIVVDLEKSHGSFMVNALDGNELIDFYTMFASLPIGFNHPKMVGDQEFLKKLQRAALTNVANSDVYTEEYASFVDTFRRIAVPMNYKHLFFVAGGALAVENALKAAFDWKTRLNFKNGKACQADKVIHLEGAFHGRSGYTMSLTNTDSMKTAFFPKFEWEDVRISKKVMESGSLNKLKIDLNYLSYRREDRIAAFIFEPIQGEGGDVHFDPVMLEEIRDWCRRNDVMFIADEVQTGLGLTGKMWASEWLQPDIIVFGKKMQVCGIMANDLVDTVAHNVFNVGSRINSTWGGNLVDMVRAEKVLQIIEEENLVDNAKKIGLEMKHILDNMVSVGYPIFNVRGEGLMIAFDVAEKRDKLRETCWKSGVAVLPCGKDSIRLRPPLNISYEEADRGLARIRKAFVEVYKL